MSTYSFAFMTSFTTLFFKLKSHHLIYEHLLFEWTKKSCCIIHDLLELALFYLPMLIFPHSSACQRAHVWVTVGQLPWYRNTALLSQGIFTAEFLRLSLLTEEPLASSFSTDPFGVVSGNSSDLSPQKKIVKTSPWAITTVILWYFCVSHQGHLREHKNMLKTRHRKLLPRWLSLNLMPLKDIHPR